jgi:hypothetical protein
MIRTAGRWDRSAKNVYFIASGIDTLIQGAVCHSHLLCAVNEIRSDENVVQLSKWAKEPARSVFIDSGVFSLTNEHARAHDMTMNDVLQLPPTELDGFDELFEKYCTVIRQLGDDVWGYIEIDQGGRENKKITRARLEKLGFRPIPVYHPLSDGWDYFDELAEGYDRICFGNVVHADVATRKRFMATAWERRRKYPHLWIHFLGLSVNQMSNAYPIDSCDSSSWVNLVRWPDSFRARNAGESFSVVPNVSYVIGDDKNGETGHLKARQLGGYDAQFSLRNWRAVLQDYRGSLEVDPDGYTGLTTIRRNTK